VLRRCPSVARDPTTPGPARRCQHLSTQRLSKQPTDRPLRPVYDRWRSDWPQCAAKSTLKVGIEQNPQSNRPNSNPILGYDESNWTNPMELLSIATWANPEVWLTGPNCKIDQTKQNQIFNGAFNCQTASSRKISLEVSGTESIYRAGQKKWGDFKLMAIILSNLNRFSKLFHWKILGKFIVKSLLTTPPHFKYVATLPCSLSLIDSFQTLMFHKVVWQYMQGLVAL